MVVGVAFLLAFSMVGFGVFNVEAWGVEGPTLSSTMIVVFTDSIIIVFLIGGLSGAYMVTC